MLTINYLYGFLQIFKSIFLQVISIPSVDGYYEENNKLYNTFSEKIVRMGSFLLLSLVFGEIS